MSLEVLGRTICVRHTQKTETSTADMCNGYNTPIQCELVRSSRGPSSLDAGLGDCLGRRKGYQKPDIIIIAPKEYDRLQDKP